MANHATVTQTSSTAPPPPLPLPRSSTSRTITPEMERDRTLLHHPSSSSRLPPIPPARPGTGIRIHSASTTVMSTAHQRVPTSPLTVPRVPAPSLPLRNNNNMSSSSRSNNSGVIVVIVPPPPQTTTTTSTTSEQQQQQQTTNEIPISLSQPRPDGERVRNEYIDTPLKGGLGRLTPLHAETHPHIHIGGSPHDHLALVSPLGPPSSSKTSSSKSLPHTALTPSTSPALQRLHNTRRSLPITKQPINAKDQYPSSSSSRHGQQQLLNADQVAAAASDSLCPSSSSFSSSSRTTIVSGGGGGKVGGGGGNDSIICSECNRCRCQSCRTPRPLPSKWLCGDKCLCSADSCVDYVSCLCCVKGLFYHCGPPTEDDQDPSEERLHRHHHHSRSSSRSSSSKEGGGGSSKTCADAPCSCAPGHNRLARWGCLASLSLVLPCLLCYWPLRGGVKVVEMCYQKCTQHGCQCDQQQHQQQQQRNSSSTTHHQQQQPLSGGKMVVNNQPVSSKRLLDN